MTEWDDFLGSLNSSIQAAQGARLELEKWETEAAATIAKFARSDGIELDPEAIKASVTRPYTIIPDQNNPKKALLIHWRGVKMPIFGWVKKQDPAFTIAEVTRGMDMLTPLPGWLKKELGWRAPEHKATIDGTKNKLSIESGDETTFKKRYGAYLGAKNPDGSYKIKGSGWIKLVAALLEDGILPFSSSPVAKEYWDGKAKSPITLKDYQVPFVKEFRDKGAIFLNIPPGAGKTWVSLFILTHFTGKVLILNPTVILCEQWAKRLKEFPTGSDVTILTYASGRKALGKQWDLVIFDEVQTLPADTFSKLAFLETKYRIGLSATPYREDGRQYMITALSGFPCYIPWAELIKAGVLKRPRVIVVTVPNNAARVRYTQNLLANRRGRALVFCDYLEQGQAIADTLDIPFVSGETRNKLDKLQDGDAHVVSRIADRGLDFPDLALVVEVAFLGKSREQEAQRLGRLLHSQKKGEHYLIFTTEEAVKFKARIYGIEAELAGAVDIEFLDLSGGSKEIASDSKPKAGRRISTIQPKPGDEIGAALSSPAIARLILDHEKNLGATRQGYMARAFRILWQGDGSTEDLRLRNGKSIKGWEAYQAGLNQLVKARLAVRNNAGIYFLDRARVKSLSG